MRLQNTLLGLLALSATTSISVTASARTLEVVASFSVLADVVKQVGGSHVNVKGLVGPNGDPHEFQPSPNDAKILKSADLAFVSGDGLETWFDRLAKAAGYKSKPIVASSGIKTLRMEEDGKTVIDPHVWNSAANVVTWVDNIEKALATADPEDASDIKANADRYRKQLTELDAYAKSRIDAVSKEKRKVLTSHDAFGYFGAAYGVTFLSPVGISTETEPSAAAVAKLITQIKAERINVYFIENSNDSRLVKQIAAATGAKAGGDLFVESLSAPEGPASSYAKMFRHNVDLIADAMAK